MLETIIGSPSPFLDKIFSSLEREKIDIAHFELDHICYRVQTNEQYEIKKNQLSSLAELLIEAPVNGRLISTFKLNNPIHYKERKIWLIELPAPKPHSTHAEGLEHVEFVMKHSFDDFEKLYPTIKFNKKGSTKEFNPELEIEFADCAVKFHHLSLESVIQCEKELIPPLFCEVTKINSLIRYQADYFTEKNFVGKKINGYESDLCLLTKEAASAISCVADELKSQKLGLKIFDAYRPVRAVEHFKAWAKETNQMHLFDQGFLAHKSSHSRGSTVDLTLYDLMTNQELDMGTPFDEFSERSYTHHEHLTTEQKKNREILLTVMKQFGFRNYYQEWWHFTLINEPHRNVYFDFPIKRFA